jgi:hypothetical protein
MSLQTEKAPKIGTEITVRISLTFQEAPDVHTLLAMTPVRERGKLVRLALERYIVETGHSAGNVEQQIDAISTWLRSRNGRKETMELAPLRIKSDLTVDLAITHDGCEILATKAARSDPAPEETAGVPSSIKRWLQS